MYIAFDCIWQGKEFVFGDTSYDGMMSQSMVLECQQGSEVWLEASASDCYVFGDSSQRYSVFGGFILQRQ